MKNWHVIDPSAFSYTGSYGFDPDVVRSQGEVRGFDNALNNASAVVEYHGEPVDGSVFDQGKNGMTMIDDLLAFMSVYSGRYCQYLWKERRDRMTSFSASQAIQVNTRRHGDEWAASHAGALDYFESSLRTIPTVALKQFELAVRWFFSALREFEIGRPLVESALNWVCLESQANYLSITGKKLDKVRTLLNQQGFPTILV